MFDCRDQGRAKAGKAGIGAISRRTERLVTGYLAALGASLRGRSKPSLVVQKALSRRRNWLTRSSTRTLSTELCISRRGGRPERR
jgi:hypothetical protein